MLKMMYGQQKKCDWTIDNDMIESVVNKEGSNKINYLCIDEDGFTYGIETIEEETITAFDSGLIEIIDVVDMKTLNDFHSNSWNDIEVY